MVRTVPCTPKPAEERIVLPFLILASVLGSGEKYVFEFQETPVTVERQFVFSESRVPCTPARRMYIFTSKQCPHCPKMDLNGSKMTYELKELGRRRYRIGYSEANHFQIVDIEREPRLKTLFKIATLPAFVVVEAGKELRRSFGKKTPEEIEELYLGPRLKVAGVPVKISVKTYNGPKTRWSWPGGTEYALRVHLSQEHGADTRGLSFSELRALHDYLHNMSVLNSRR